MPRRKLIRQNEFPYHVTTRTNNKSWFNIPIFEVWDICKLALIRAQKAKPCILHCFVLMGNHYHMLITTPESNIDEFMFYFNKGLSDLINKHTGVINHKFSNRYSWCIVENESYLHNVYRYIYQNPVRANITKDCFSYPYSSLHFTRFESKILKHNEHYNYSKEKLFFEKKYGSTFDILIRNSLKKKTFKVNTKASVLYKRILLDSESK